MTDPVPSKIDYRGRLYVAVVCSVTTLTFALADRRLRAEETSSFVPATAEEPLGEFSLERAARSLDASALAWQEKNKCSQCHANIMYLVARPLLDHIVPSPPDVRALYESLAEQGGVDKSWRKPLAFDPPVTAVPLAHHDRQTTGTLHPQTRSILNRVLQLQRPDGGWSSTAGGRSPILLDYELTMLIAAALAQAPDGYADAPRGRKVFDGIRRFASEHPPQSPYQHGMLLWAGHHVAGLHDDGRREQAVAELSALQRDDGGWTLKRLLKDDEKLKNGKFAEAGESDGYATGFAIFTLRQGEVPADDARLQRGIAWLKSHQRASGRWFTRSPGGAKQNLHSNAGTAFAVMALAACGEVAAKQP